MKIEVGDYVRTNKGNITKMSSEEFIENGIKLSVKQIVSETIQQEIER